MSEQYEIQDFPQISCGEKNVVILNIGCKINDVLIPTPTGCT